LINGLAVTASAEVIRQLEFFPGVESIRLDATLQAPEVTFDTSTVPEWNLSAIRTRELWALGYAGQGVVVANMDTGVDVDHPDLRTKWRGGDNSWYDPNGQHVTPYDADGHGTQTMGILVGGDAGGTAIGVAPDAKWIAVKIFNDAGQSTLSLIHQGFQWLLDPDGNPDTDDAPDIVNNSWGHDNINGCSLEFEPDTQALKAVEISVVFAGGNFGPNPSTSISPANNPDGFAVGAVDQTLSVASFSSRGPSPCDGSIYPELVAPGVAVRTADLTFGGLFPDSYVTASGTSFAAPHSAGSMALLLNAFPGLSVSELELALKQSAFDRGLFGPDNDYGYGVVDVAEAYQLLLHPAPDISTFPGSHLFSDTKVGSLSPPQVFTVINRGLRDLTIDGISMTGAEASQFVLQNDGCSMKTLSPAATCAVQVAFSPTSGGQKSVSLSIDSNDPDQSSLLVSLTGRGIAPPSAAILLSPSGKTTNPLPAYTWNAVPDSIWYHLWVNDSTGTPKVNQWVRAAEAGCAEGKGTCSIAPNTPLAAGNATWWIQTWNPVGYGPWSVGMSFQVSLPQAATLLSPTGSITTTLPTYTWNAVPDTTWYRLWVNDSTGNKIAQWYMAADAGCASGTGTCSVTPAIELAAGAGSWWIQTYSPAGYGPWSAAMKFNVNVSPPGVATLITPNGLISTNTPTYTWNAVSGSTWYYLWVNDATGNRIAKWYRATEAGCPSGTGTCSVIPAVALAKGEARWWVQTYNGTGYGPWSSALPFTVGP
jgi:hypothetical protein